MLALIPRLRRYARVLTRDAGDAEDLVQESLLRAHERPATFRKTEALGAWLMSILHNTFVDQYRARTASARREAAFAQLLPMSQDAPQEMTVRLAQLRRAFMDLPEEQRTALHLVAIEGLSYAEAASVLNIPQGTLMSRLGRARAALRALEDTPRFSIIGGRDDRR